ncbi:hypothetical protein CFC21_105682 [Triticum aestivum]|uniref:DUF4220 domain-containing protein n=3 Tax=Triticum TaxID=4564 RepID=A0A9R1AC48_TRITD|nr:uncharacterized protein LOC123160357 [Triticum aestivum]KAF7104814.1 hypothetical protein CFC21_105682 [Triticum aestivum]VAI93506.1 unnamed protein product [Triticum turgidum subsp. durum]
MLGNVAHPQVGVPMGGTLMQSWMELWNEWEIQTVVVASFSLQVLLFFFAGIRRYTVSSILKVLLWFVYLFADVVATYGLGHMSSSVSKKSSSEHQLVAFWAPFLLLHLGGQDTITAYALEDNELWRRHPPRRRTPFLLRIYAYFSPKTFSREGDDQKGGDCFTKNKQFRAYEFIVMTAHELRHVLVKPLIIDRNEASIDWNYKTTALVKGLVQGFPWQDDESEDALAKEQRTVGELYKGIEVQLGLMYDMLYTKAEVIHKSRGHWIRAISLVCCFTALVVFTRSKRDGYSTPNIVITFALLGGACALEVTSVLKAIGSTWTYDILRRYRCKWLANAVLFARYHLVVVKDGRWSNSVGQFDFISFCVHSSKRGLKGTIARLIGVKDLWDKARCTKHAKLSPAAKEFVWGLLKGDKTHMVEIEEADMRSGNWARRFRGIDDRIKQLDWSMSFEFQKSVVIWHIATSTFLSNPAVKSKLVDKDMAEEVNTLSHYMMYLLVKHPDILRMKPAAKDMFEETCLCYGLGMHRLGWKRSNVVDFHHVILDYNKGGKHLEDEPYDGLTMTQRLKYIEDLYGDLTHPSWDAHPGDAVLVKASTLAHTLLDVELGLTYKMAIIRTVWMEMLCYAATNAAEGFHARQLSNGGEFLTHILLLTKYSSFIDNNNPKPSMEADETVEASTADHVQLNVDDDSNDETIEIRPM